MPYVIGAIKSPQCGINKFSAPRRYAVFGILCRRCALRLIHCPLFIKTRLPSENQSFSSMGKVALKVAFLVQTLSFLDFTRLYIMIYNNTRKCGYFFIQKRDNLGPFILLYSLIHSFTVIGHFHTVEVTSSNLVSPKKTELGMHGDSLGK